MEIELIRADRSDAETIWRMQVKAFALLLEKYQDFDTNPGNETLERVQRRFDQSETYFYRIVLNGETVGAIRIYDSKDGISPKRISPLFVLPEYQGRGIAQAAIREAERIHGRENWALDTILQEAGNCRLYEKMGYRQTGERRIINGRMTLIGYEKNECNAQESGRRNAIPDGACGDGADRL